MTLHLVFLCLLPLVMAFVHRLRGGGFVHLPFKATYAVWIVPGLMAWGASGSWGVGLTWAIGYLIWILPGWMSVITEAEGADVPAGQVMSETWDVRLVDDIDGGDAIIGCYVRAALFLAPLAIALPLTGSPFWPLLTVVAVFWPAYWAAYHLSPTNQSAIAELLVGGFGWGAAEILSIVLRAHS